MAVLDKTRFQKIYSRSRQVIRPGLLTDHTRFMKTYTASRQVPVLLRSAALVVSNIVTEADDVLLTESGDDLIV